MRSVMSLVMSLRPPVGNASFRSKVTISYSSPPTITHTHHTHHTCDIFLPFALQKLFVPYVCVCVCVRMCVCLCVCVCVCVCDIFLPSALQKLFVPGVSLCLCF